MSCQNEICEQYEFDKQNATTGGIEIVRKLSDCVGSVSDRSLLRQVKLFLLGGGGKGDYTTTNLNDEVVDEDEDQQNDGD